MIQNLRDNPLFVRSIGIVRVLVKIVGYSLLITVWLAMAASLGAAWYVQYVMMAPGGSSGPFYQLAFLLALTIVAMHLLGGLWPFRLPARNYNYDKSCKFK